MKALLYTIICCTLTTICFAQKVTIKDTDDNVLVEFNDEGTTGSLTLLRGAAPTDQHYKLYNVNNELFWHGTKLGTEYQAGGWRVSGLNLFPLDPNSLIGIGLSNPLAKQHILQEGTEDAFRVDDMSTDTTPFLINALGSVGIGSSAPADKVHIIGDLRLEELSSPLLKFYHDDNYVGYTGVIGTTMYLNHRQNGPLSIRTNNAPRMTIAGTGEVGIGTTTPTQRLDVIGKIKIGDDGTTPTAGVVRYNSASQEFEGYDGSAWNSFGGSRWLVNGSHIYYNAGHAALGTANPSAKLHIVQGTTTDAFRVDDNVFDTTPFIIKADGDVGIGTEAPGFPLEVKRTNSGNNLNPVALFKSVGANSSGAIRLEGSNGHYWTLGTTQDPSNAFALNYDSNISIGSDLLRVTPAGRLGIGTIDPKDKLHVVGDARIEDTNHPILQFYEDDTYAGFAGTIGADMHICNNLSGNLYLKTKNTSRLTIDSSGFVGIGTTNPSYPLHVVGSDIVRTGYFEIETDSAFASGVYGSGSGEGPVAGTYGKATGDSLNYGIVGLAFNGDINYGGKFTTNTVSPDKGYAIYGNATGTGTNYAGYFEDGDVVLESGDLGVGILEPTAKAHILQDVGGVDAFRVDDETGDATPFIIKSNGATAVGTTLPMAKMHIVEENANDAFRVDDEAGDDTPFVITKDGKVGIGTASPSSQVVAFSNEINGPMSSYIGWVVEINEIQEAVHGAHTSDVVGGLSRSDNGPDGIKYWGAYGFATDNSGHTNIGVRGDASGATTNWGGYFTGGVYVDDSLLVNASVDILGGADVAGSVDINGSCDIAGLLTKGAGTFRIDHPLDPENKYLYHSFVESPDMMNVYNGNIITNDEGYMEVKLPEYFEALNKDFRYQLTVIGDFAQAIISKKINQNRFVIRTDKPNIEVSWQVTGIRKDAYANKNRIQVEEDKAAADRGTYLHPEAFGKPETMKQGFEEQLHN